MRQSKEDKIEKTAQDDIAAFLGQSVTAPIQEALKGIAKEETIQEKLDTINATCQNVTTEISNITRRLGKVKEALIKDENDDPIPDQIKEAKDDALKSVTSKLDALNGAIPNINEKLENIVKGETAHLDTRIDGLNQAEGKIREDVSSIQEQIQTVGANTNLALDAANSTQQKLNTL